MVVRYVSAMIQAGYALSKCMPRLFSDEIFPDASLSGGQEFNRIGDSDFVDVFGFKGK